MKFARTIGAAKISLRQSYASIAGETQIKVATTLKVRYATNVYTILHDRIWQVIGRRVTSDTDELFDVAYADDTTLLAR